MNREITKLRDCIESANASLHAVKDIEGFTVYVDRNALQSLLAAARAHLKYMEQKEAEQKSVSSQEAASPVSPYPKSLKAPYPEGLRKPLEIIDALDLENKESIVDLLFLIEPGRVSIRRAASEIMRAHKVVPLCCDGCGRELRDDEYHSDVDGQTMCDDCFQAVKDHEPSSIQDENRPPAK